MKKTVPERLAALGELYRQRNVIYKDNYKRFGKILSEIFPNGLHLQTVEDFNRFSLFFQIMHKQTRYANSIQSGGHADSLDDISVYAQMLREYDDEANEQAKEALRQENLKPIQNENYPPQTPGVIRGGNR